MLHISILDCIPQGLPPFFGFVNFFRQFFLTPVPHDFEHFPTFQSPKTQSIGVGVVAMIVVGCRVVSMLVGNGAETVVAENWQE